MDLMVSRCEGKKHDKETEQSQKGSGGCALITIRSNRIDVGRGFRCCSGSYLRCRFLQRPANRRLRDFFFLGVTVGRGNYKRLFILWLGNIHGPAIMKLAITGRLLDIPSEGLSKFFLLIALKRLFSLQWKGEAKLAFCLCRRRRNIR